MNLHVVFLTLIKGKVCAFDLFYIAKRFSVVMEVKPLRNMMKQTWYVELSLELLGKVFSYLAWRGLLYLGRHVVV